MLQVQIVDKKFCNRISLNSDYNVNRKLLEEKKKKPQTEKKNLNVLITFQPTLFNIKKNRKNLF